MNQQVQGTMREGAQRVINHVLLRASIPRNGGYYGVADTVVYS
jgi:hypothetical protein